MDEKKRHPLNLLTVRHNSIKSLPKAFVLGRGSLEGKDVTFCVSTNTKK
jgi:hypothetical protein